jgi:hypothetical protein
MTFVYTLFKKDPASNDKKVSIQKSLIVYCKEWTFYFLAADRQKR